jgi:hypothetical protein
MYNSIDERLQCVIDHCRELGVRLDELHPSSSATEEKAIASLKILVIPI